MAESHSVKHGELVVLPSILRGLNDLRCCDGDSVTFECTILCTPHPQIRWEKDGKIIPIGTDFIAAQEGDRVTLTIAEVFPEDEGVYTCIAHNELGKATTAACLVVDVPEEKANLLSQQLSRPTNFLSAESTPRSTPRTTPRATPTRSFSPVNQLSEPRRSKSSRLKQLAPKFYTYPHNRVVEEGGSARFQCAIAGHPMPWVTWDKDGIIVTPSARLTIKEKEDLRILEIEEVTLEDAGLYRLTLENDVGRVEATARLDVICLKGSSKGGVRAYSSSPRRSPCVHRHLIGSAARAGERLKLMADIRSSSTTSYKWYKNGMEISADTPRITQQIDKDTVSLEIENLKLCDTGEYFVLAQNKDGIASSFADVKVVDDVIENRPPTFKKPLPPSIDIIEGESLTLKCEVESNNSFEIEWFRGGELLPHCDDLIQQFDYGGGRIGLIVNDTFLDDKGLYECVVSNSFGKCSSQVRVNVKEVDEETFHDSYKYKLEFSKEPLAIATYVGNGTSFCAKVNPSDDYDEQVEVVWVVGDEEIDNKNKLFHMESYEDTHILHIMRIERWMAGDIVCQAKLPNRTKRVIAKATTQLILMPSAAVFEECESFLGKITPASLVKPLKDITVLRGQTIAIKAYLDGVPEPKVRWFKGVHEIKSEYNTIRPKYSIVSHAKESSLIVTRATDDDAGTYTVRVENSSGGGIATASVSVEGTPDAPNGKPSVLVLNGEAIVTWSSAPYDGSSAITGYVLEMVCVNIPNAAWQCVAEKCHSLTATVSGLEHDEVYRFRVRAVNVHGQGPPSEETDPVSLNDEGDPTEEDVINPNHVVLQGISEFKENYQILGEIGRGNFGTVCLVKNKEGQKLAAKIIKTPLASDKNSVKNEIDIMNCLKHSKLLQLYAAYETDIKMILVTEYISGGELFERVAADDFTLTEDDCIIFMKQICEGVNYMHRNYIVHLDLKPENIMCRTRTSNLIKLIDFGLARRIDPKVPLKVSYGTRDFISPEIANFEAVSFESDMWSVGVICYVLLSGLLPFGGDTWAETLVNISRVEYDFYDEAFDAVSDDAKEFISKLLIKMPQERLTAEQCLNHKWIARYGDVTRNIKLNTEKLKKFVVKRKWHKSGNALRALKRLVTMTAHTRRGSTSRPILEE